MPVSRSSFNQSTEGAGVIRRSWLAGPAAFPTLPIRFLLTAALIAGELVALSILVDTADFRFTGGLGGLLANWGASGASCLLLGLVLSVVFASVGSGRSLRESPAVGWISRSAAALHLCVLPAFIVGAIRLFDPQGVQASAGPMALLCAVAGLATVASGLVIFVPGSWWFEFFRPRPLAPLYGMSVAAGVFALSAAWHGIWRPWMRLTFGAVRLCLGLFRSDVVADPASFSIGTRAFHVIVSAGCSGFEGVALMLLFGSAWLWVFRSEFRFPQALSLVPAGMVAIWILNVVRITALILIGNAGARGVALGGFHSQAGWIAFVCLALAFSLASRRVAWISSTPHAPLVIAGSAPDATAAYLMPFLAILGAGMVSAAASGTFEWGYGWRVLAAAAVFWYFRRTYRGVNWRVGWEAPAVGVAVFAIWMAADRWLTPHAAMPMPVALAAAAVTARVVWLLLRVTGGVVTVPVAEELAFRGYALRRLVSADFTAVDLRRFTLMAFAASSLMFGVLHGRRWLAGTLAGMAYAAVARRRGSLGDAALAHAVTNALLAAWVLWSGDWSLW